MGAQEPRGSAASARGVPQSALETPPIWDPLERVFYTIFVDHKLSDRVFLLYMYPAAQL